MEWISYKFWLLKYWLNKLQILITKRLNKNYQMVILLRCNHAIIVVFKKRKEKKSYSSILQQLSLFL